MVKVRCPHCNGTGLIDKPLHECTPYELAKDAHEKAIDLWKQHNLHNIRNLVAVLHELRKRLEDDP